MSWSEGDARYQQDSPEFEYEVLVSAPARVLAHVRVWARDREEAYDLALEKCSSGHAEFEWGGDVSTEFIGLDIEEVRKK